MQKVVDFYLKINKSPGPDKFQAELIETMPTEQIRVLQKWLNEILAKGELVTKVTEEEYVGQIDITPQRRIEVRPGFPLATSCSVKHH